MVISTAVIAAILAALAAGGYAGSGALGQLSMHNANEDNSPHKYTGWAYDMYGNHSAQNTDLAKFFRKNFYQNDFLDSLSDNQLAAILDQYYYKSGGAFGNDQYDFDLKAAQSDLQKLLDAQINAGPLPELPDWDALKAQAQEQIANENAEINALYDTNLNNQRALLEQQLADNNENYNMMANQILTNDYQKNSQLLGTVGRSLDRSRQNALEAGASAGIRLSNSINTLLSTQNKQAQQSLETSNNLAQQMLNQRQAAMGLRSQYGNYLNQNAQNKADLMKGNAERINSYTRNQYDLAMNEYNAKMNNYETQNSAQQDNPFYGAYNSYNQTNNYKNKYLQQ